MTSALERLEKLLWSATAEKKTELCHTLNGSALALPRIVAALLENNQTPEGIRDVYKRQMIDEVRRLIEQGIPPEDLIYYGLEYKYLTLYVTLVFTTFTSAKMFIAYLTLF